MANEYDEQSTFEEDIEAILTTDSVKGDPPGFSGTLTGKINVVLFHIVNRTRWLKNTLAALNITVPNASTTTKGIAELATKAEAEAATDTTRITPPKRVLDLLRATVAAATETVRGTVRRATKSEAEGGTNNEKMMTSLRTKEHLQHSNAQATTSQRGTVKKATQQQVNAGTAEDEYVTPKTLNESDAIQGIKAAATATVTASAGSNFTVLENIVIGKILFLRIKFTSNWSGANLIISGGKWRLMSAIYYSNSANTYENGGGNFDIVTNVQHNTNNLVLRPISYFNKTNNLMSIIAVLES